MYRNCVYQAACVIFLVALCARIISGCQCTTRHPQQHFCESDFVIRAKVLEKIYEPIYRGTPLHMSPKHNVQEVLKPSTAKPATGMDILAGSPRLRMADRPQQTYREASNNENWNPWQYKLSYRVYIEKIYKGEGKVKAKTKVRLVSPSDSGICGMTNMDEKTKYLITGTITDKGLTVHLCNWVVQHTELTKSQRTGIKHMYKKYCNKCTIQPGVIFWPPEAKEKDVCTYNPYLLYDDDCEGKHSACVRKPNGSCDWSKNSRMRKCEKRRSFPLDDTSQYTVARVGVL